MRPFSLCTLRAYIFVALLPSATLLPSVALADGSIKETYGPASNPITTSTNYRGGFSDNSSYSFLPGWSVMLNGMGLPNGQTYVQAQVLGTVAAIAQNTVTNSTATYTLQPPPGANFAGGQLVIYGVLGPASLEGDAAFEIKLGVVASRGATWEVQNSGQVTVTESPGSEQVELPVAVVLPTTLDSTQSAAIRMRLEVTATARIAPVAGQLQSADAQAYYNPTKIAAFRVLNAAGVQITGFSLTAGGSRIEERAAADPGLVRAIEFYNPSYDHYFVTVFAAEIANLDSGATPGWQRTSQSFNAYAGNGSGRVAVCRFYGVFGTKSSHFYTPYAEECEKVKSNPSWSYEGIAFYALLPDVQGACPAASVPVYRLYNNGMGGAPNHRFTTSEVTFTEMQAQGYIPEGAGVGVGWCAPQ